MSPGLARMIFWVAVALCAVAHAALIWSVVTGAASGSYPEDRRKGPRRGGMRWGPDRRSSTAKGDSSPVRELEIGWAILPALALVTLLIATWRALPA